MASVGPKIPSYLMGKRRLDEAEDDDDDAVGPAVPTSLSQPPSSGPDAPSKRQRVMGPSMPPALLDQQLLKAAGSDPDSDSDDDFGPSLPPVLGSREHANEVARVKAEENAAAENDTSKQRQRDEWMLVPPSSEDWSSRIDPTKLRNRKFNTGKGAKAPIAKEGVSATWLETPEEKRKRLEDEVMGIKKPANMDTGSSMNARNEAEIRATDRRIKQYNESNRSSSLYEEHKKTVPKEKEDDPSSRAFDREKDIGGGMKIGHAKRKELLTKAADFGSRFAKGNYL